MKQKFIPVAKVRPGQDFMHYGQLYRRALDEEEHRHPGRENPRYRTRGDVVLAYMRADQPVPVTFVEDTRVNVKGDR